MDLIIILAVIALVIFFFKRFSNVVYIIVIVDIFLRIVNYINVRFLTGVVHNFIATNFPSSVPAVLAKYSNGLFYDVLMVLFVIVYIIFESYIIRTFFKRN